MPTKTKTKIKRRSITVTAMRYEDSIWFYHHKHGFLTKLCWREFRNCFGVDVSGTMVLRITLSPNKLSRSAKFRSRRYGACVSLYIGVPDSDSYTDIIYNDVLSQIGFPTGNHDEFYITVTVPAERRARCP